MKSGSESALAFGRVIQAIRKHASKNQADVAGAFEPPISVAAVSMAESGNRPPKTEAVVRAYASALDLDGDDLVELWWAMQGLVEVDDYSEQRRLQRWWHELTPGVDATYRHLGAEQAAKEKWTPNDDVHAPPLALFALSEEVGAILLRLLGDGWQIRYRWELGLREPVDGRLANVVIELLFAAGNDSADVPTMVTSFPCPAPVARPVTERPTERPVVAALPRDVAWILAAVEGLPARDRAAVAGFIHGLREGAALYGEAREPG